MEIAYSPTFVRMLKMLPRELQDETIEKIDLFKQPKNHLTLKVYKLKGRLKGRYSFSINYKTRIVFTYLKQGDMPCLLAIGEHDVYSP